MKRRIAAAFGVVTSATACIVLVVHLCLVGPYSVTITVRRTADSGEGWSIDIMDYYRSEQNMKIVTAAQLPTTSVSILPSSVNPRPSATPIYSSMASLSPLPSTASPPKPKRQLYALSLSFMDQTSWAASRLKSLQCWATTWKSLYKEVHIVEPFVTNGSHLGVPIDVDQTVNESLKFRDIFDIDTWNSKGNRRGIKYPELVSWNNFLQYAPRNVVVVQIVYDYDVRCTENDFTEPTCGSARLNETLSRILRPHNFAIINQICVNFRLLGALSLQDFNRHIFDPIPKHIPLTVVFDEWRGPGDKWSKSNKAFVQIKGGICTPNSPYGYVKLLTTTTLTPSSKMKKQAQVYISRYLNDPSGYVAVLIRWEKLLLSKFYGRHYWPSTGAKCVKKISDRVKSFYSESGIKSAFITTDIGKFGSSTFSLNNITQDSIASITSYTEDLLRELHGNKSISLADHEQTFEDVAGTTSPAYISQLQKAIAANARCLLLVGWGTFHENALRMYRTLHHKEEDCHKLIRSC